MNSISRKCENYGVVHESFIFHGRYDLPRLRHDTVALDQIEWAWVKPSHCINVLTVWTHQRTETASRMVHSFYFKPLVLNVIIPAITDSTHFSTEFRYFEPLKPPRAYTPSGIVTVAWDRLPSLIGAIYSHCPVSGLYRSAVLKHRLTHLFPHLLVITPNSSDRVDTSVWSYCQAWLISNF